MYVKQRSTRINYRYVIVNDAGFDVHSDNYRLYVSWYFIVEKGNLHRCWCCLVWLAFGKQTLVGLIFKYRNKRLCFNWSMCAFNILLGHNSKCCIIFVLYICIIDVYILFIYDNFVFQYYCCWIIFGRTWNVR